MREVACPERTDSVREFSAIYSKSPERAEIIMPTIYFNDIPIDKWNIVTWPASPDREKTGQGAQAYLPLIQHINSRYRKSINLSLIQDKLNQFNPTKINGVTVYQTDPAPFIVGFLGKQQAYLIDDTFPPDIWNTPKITDDVTSHRRVGDFVPNGNMYNQSPKITDMYQASLGDYSFVSMTGGTCESIDTHNIQFTSIYPPAYNGTGVYSVRFFANEKYYYVVIDDLIETAFYVSMDDGIFWYYLYEKAIAKVCQGYHKLNENYCTYTVFENTFHWLQDDNDAAFCVASLKDMANKNKVALFANFNSRYLVNKHAYAILDYCEYNDTKFIRLHNPWNVITYKGPYCPGSSDWDNVPPIIQKDLFQLKKFKQKSFWMPYELLPNKDCYIRFLDIPGSTKEVFNGLYGGVNIQNLTRVTEAYTQGYYQSRHEYPTVKGLGKAYDTAKFQIIKETGDRWDFSAPVDENGNWTWQGQPGQFGIGKYTVSSNPELFFPTASFSINQHV